MKTKISIFLALIFLASGALFSQETNKIKYSDGPCIEKSKVNQEGHLAGKNTDLSFTLENDSLRVAGIIEANCCGTHYLSYEIKNDSLLLYRTDEGELCDCLCSYKIDVKIGKCTSKEYTVCLGKYELPTEWEISEKVLLSGIIDKSIKEAKVYPNPVNSSTQIEFSAENGETYRFELYNEFGELLRSINDISVGKILLRRGNLTNGKYFYRILQMNGDCKYNGTITLL